MPSIVADLNGSRENGMKLLGAWFNYYFTQTAPVLTPVEVLHSTFTTITGLAVPVTVSHLIGGVLNPLTSPTVTGNSISFVYTADALLNPGQQRTVKIVPQDDKFEDAAMKKFVMHAAFSSERTDLLADTNYLEETVTHIVTEATSGTILEAKKYALAALTFSRCK